MSVIVQRAAARAMPRGPGDLGRRRSIRRGVAQNLSVVTALVDAIRTMTGEEIDAVIVNTMACDYHLQFEPGRRTDWAKVFENVTYFAAEWNP
jgi:hypothetical protein